MSPSLVILMTLHPISLRVIYNNIPLTYYFMSPSLVILMTLHPIPGGDKEPQQGDWRFLLPLGRV